MQSHLKTSQDTPITKFGDSMYFYSKVIVWTTPYGPILTIFGPNDLEGQGQMSPYAIPSKNFPRYTYKPNLVILGTFFQMLLSGQARFGPILTVFGPNDLEDQCQMSPYAIPF